MGVCCRGEKMCTDIHAYATSKLWDLMVGLEMNERCVGLPGECTANRVHPSTWGL